MKIDLSDFATQSSILCESSLNVSKCFKPSLRQIFSLICVVWTRDMVIAKILARLKNSRIILLFDFSHKLSGDSF